MPGSFCFCVAACGTTARGASCKGGDDGDSSSETEEVDEAKGGDGETKNEGVNEPCIRTHATLVLECDSRFYTKVRS